MMGDAMPALPSWAQLGGSFVWAPEVIPVADQYVMYYTARDTASDKQCVGVRRGRRRPTGRFKDSNDHPLVCQADLGGTIDPSPFRDGDKLYLYFKNDGNCCGITTSIYVQELSADGLQLQGKPAALIENNEFWEGQVIEAPTMFKHDTGYYLFFSANDYAGANYAVGYATCDTPTGPCKQADENPDPQEPDDGTVSYWSGASGFATGRRSDVDHLPQLGDGEWLARRPAVHVDRSRQLEGRQTRRPGAHDQPAARALSARRRHYSSPR